MLIRPVLQSYGAVRFFLCLLFVAGALVFACGLSACAQDSDDQSSINEDFAAEINDRPALSVDEDAYSKSFEEDNGDAKRRNSDLPTITESYRSSLSHGEKTAANQRYIVLHDTEGGGTPLSVVDWWESNGNYVAAHFVIGKDGNIVQCVPLDEIAHHAGFGDTGHNKEFGIEEDGRDDMRGTTSIGKWASDYGMNAWSIGIEMVHVGGEGDYPEAQLEALDELISYIDSYYGFESQIIDHKAWRTGNSDTSKEFASYLANYKDHRTHD